MSAEYEVSKEEAMQKLAASCANNLKRLQDANVPGMFSFRDNWDRVKTDPLVYHISSNRFVRTIIGYPETVRTWAQYNYKDGNLVGELIQDQSSRNLYGEMPVIIQISEGYRAENVPFNEFSENDLFNAAKAIEHHIPVSSPKEKVA